MQRIGLWGALAVLGIGLLLAPGVTRAEMSAEQRRDVEAVVRDYLVQNPEIIEEALLALQAKRQEEARAGEGEAIARLGSEIDSGKDEIVLGNPEGDVTLVEFFDYNCGYCRRALGDMQALLETDENVRFIMKEFPILSEGSVQSARVSLAVHALAPEKYEEFHTQMFTTRGQADGEKAMRIATELGLDEGEVARIADADETSQEITQARALADQLGMSGTPSYVLGDEVVRGAVGLEALREKIANLRACGSTACEG